MKHSTHRILTTHAGRLEGPAALREALGSFQQMRPVDAATLAPLVHDDRRHRPVGDR